MEIIDAIVTGLTAVLNLVGEVVMAAEKAMSSVADAVGNIGG
jgi:hypothetical protein